MYSRMSCSERWSIALSESKIRSFTKAKFYIDVDKFITCKSYRIAASQSLGSYIIFRYGCNEISTQQLIQFLTDASNMLQSSDFL